MKSILHKPLMKNKISNDRGTIIKELHEIEKFNQKISLKKRIEFFS